MPQPYLPQFQHHRYSVGLTALTDRPKFAEAIGQCLGMWPNVENALVNLFALLMGAESPIAHKVFVTLRRRSNQREALDAVAFEKLSGDDLSYYRAIMGSCTGLEKRRNDLAHSCFGYSIDDSSLLLAIKLEDHAAWHVPVSMGITTGSLDGLFKKLMVYKLPELEELRASMEECWWDIVHFTNYLRIPNVPEFVGLQFQERRSSPRIQRLIAALQPTR